MDSPAEAAFLDHLYGAVADASRWAPALEALADLTHGDSAYLSRLNVATGEGPVVMARLDPAWKHRYDEQFSALNPYATAADPQAYLRSWAPTVLTGDDWLHAADLRRDTYYNEFMQPQGVHAVMFTRLAARGLNVTAITVNRPKHRDLFSAEDMATARRLHPHLLRAFQLAETLAAAGGLAAGLETALSAAPHGLIVLDEAGVIARANPPAERLIAGGYGLKVAHGRLCATMPAVDRRLQAVVTGAVGPGPRESGDLMIPGAEGRLPLALKVSPVSATADTVFQPPRSVLVAITDPNREAALSAAGLAQLFGFTATETQVAGELVRGLTAREIAAARGASFHTVRHHIQNMLDKTGVQRQSELVLLLMRASSSAQVF